MNDAERYQAIADQARTIAQYAQDLADGKVSAGRERGTAIRHLIDSVDHLHGVAGSGGKPVAEPEPPKLPSVKQMVNRANGGHYKALKAIRDNELAIGPTEPISAVRGMMTVLHTLRQWECVEGDQLTDRGRELLAAYETKWNIQ